MYRGTAKCIRCLQSQPPPLTTGCDQTQYPAGSCDFCIGQVGSKIEGAHWLWYVQGAAPVRPVLGVGSGGGEGEWVRTCSTILILTRLQDRGVHKPDPNKNRAAFCNPILHHHQ